MFTACKHDRVERREQGIDPSLRRNPSQESQVRRCQHALTPNPENLMDQVISTKSWDSTETPGLLSVRLPGVSTRIFHAVLLFCLAVSCM